MRRRVAVALIASSSVLHAPLGIRVASAQAVVSPLPAPPPAPRAPRATIRYVDLVCRYVRGTLSVERASFGQFATPTVLRRFGGRFEARILVTGGAQPIDVLRFDFPLLADADAGVNAELAERMKVNTTSQVTVRVPLPLDSAILEIVDRRRPSQVLATVPVIAPTAAPRTSVAPGAPGR